MAADFLPIAQLDDFCRYETNITAFLVVSKPVLNSSYIQSQIGKFLSYPPNIRQADFISIRLSTLILFKAFAVGVVSYRGGPVREDPQDAYVLC